MPDKNSNAARVAETLATLNEGIATLTTSSAYADWLRVAATFHDYSVSNSLLIWLQRSGATHVAGYRKWQSLGRQVRKGEKGIRILAPMIVKAKAADDADADDPDDDAAVRRIRRFRIVHVFDVSQTDGEPLPEIANRLEGAAPAQAYARLADVARSEGLTIEIEDLGAGALNGYYDRDGRRIALAADRSPAQHVKTLAHELAHHFTEGDCTRPEKEIIAESVAYCVSDALGLDTSAYSFGYVAGWAGGDLDAIKATTAPVQQITHQLLAALEQAGPITGPPPTPQPEAIRANHQAKPAAIAPATLTPPALPAAVADTTAPLLAAPTLPASAADPVPLPDGPPTTPAAHMRQWAATLTQLRSDRPTVDGLARDEWRRDCWHALARLRAWRAYAATRSDAPESERQARTHREHAGRIRATAHVEAYDARLEALAPPAISALPPLAPAVEQGPSAAPTPVKRKRGGRILQKQLDAEAGHIRVILARDDVQPWGQVSPVVAVTAAWGSDAARQAAGFLADLDAWQNRGPRALDEQAREAGMALAMEECPGGGRAVKGSSRTYTRYDYHVRVNARTAAPLPVDAVRWWKSPADLPHLPAWHSVIDTWSDLEELEARRERGETTTTENDALDALDEAGRESLYQWALHDRLADEPCHPVEIIAGMPEGEPCGGESIDTCPYRCPCHEQASGAIRKAA